MGTFDSSERANILTVILSVIIGTVKGGLIK